MVALPESGASALPIRLPSMASEGVETIVDICATWVVKLAKWALYALGAWIALGAGLFMLLNILQSTPNPFPENDLSNQEPYVDFIGREYWLKTEVDALAWNDFPDKGKILSISLMPPPGVRNRFVSYAIRLKVGQTLRILSATGRFLSTKDYVVSVPGAGLPAGIPITIRANSDGTPDPLVYALLGK